MESLKNELTRICNTLLISTDPLLKILTGSRDKELRTLKSEYYSFTPELLTAISRIDELTLVSTNKIQTLDGQNRFDDAASWGHMFECCIELRAYIETFMAQAEVALASGNDSIRQDLALELDRLQRKIAYFKNNL
ncbi:MAG: hypothetical protein J6U86_05265 [Clostridia bacterium]|nr:hypothetical protein [Clostridia bacterium]